MIKNIIYIVQIILSLLLTVLIFLQASPESDSRNNIMSTTTFEKRGWEKTIFYITIITLFAFIISSIIQIII